MKKTSLAAVLTTIALCAGLTSAATPIYTDASAKEAGITKLSTEQQVAYESYTAPTANKQADQQQRDAAQIGSMQCNESNQQNSSQPASGWTLAPAMMNGFSDGNSAPQMQTTAGTTGEQKASRFDTGQANAENVLRAKAEVVAFANASSGHDSAAVGSWATANTPNEARAQQQPAAGYIKT